MPPGPPPPQPILPPSQPARAAAPEPEAEETDAPAVKLPPKSQRAFVTITTNVPARVFIDGEPVGRRTPLSRFPVKTGARHIMLVSVVTGEAQEVELRFTRGQHRKVVVDSFRTSRR